MVENIWSVLTKKVAPSIKIGLTGDLGSGKTTLVKGLAQKLGIKEPVTSPTFTISKQYNTNDNKWPILRHLDLYRFDDISKRDLEEISEIINLENGLIAVEWIENMPKLFELMDFHIKIKVGQKYERQVEVTDL